jgi:alcohol dehydrogenase
MSATGLASEPFLMAPFDHQPRTRVVFGPNVVGRLGALAAELQGRRILLVTDGGLVAAGHVDRAVRSLVAAGLGVVVFDQAEENPTTRCVEQCRDAAQAAGIDLIVGLGGGSSLDTAKGCNFLLTNGGQMKDYWGLGKATKPMLPLIAVPTTAGTGSECQSFALIADVVTHQKMACGDPKAAARIALLDPTLTASQPPRVTACTGIDAIAHAVETAVTTKRTPLSLIYSREAFKLTVAALPRVLEHPQDLDARGRMLLGAAWGGMAIENSMLGAAHAAANPLTAHFGIPHGEAVGLMLPGVVQFNGASPEARLGYQELVSAAGLLSRDAAPESAVPALVTHLRSLLTLASMPLTLSARGVDRAALPRLAEEAARQWTATFNPRPLTAADFEALYSAAFA